jgi:gluconate 2-dehydrogenase alpha chain
MGSPGSMMVIDDFDGDNFDHGGLGFLGGCRIQCGHGEGRPITYRPTPRWGSAWKKAVVDNYQRALSIGMSGSNYANRYNYLDLDPTYRDQLVRPLLRLTYNFVENDYKLAEFCMSKVVEIVVVQPSDVEPQMRTARPCLGRVFNLPLHGGSEALDLELRWT